MNATMVFQCDICQHETSLIQPITLGRNTTDVYCAHCGEHWQIIYEVLSLETLSIGSWERRRSIGVIRDGVFFSKEQLS